jgi:hypothetical protein
MEKAKREGNDADQPWVSNYPPLDEWLKENNAVCNWQLQRGERKSRPLVTVESWSINGYAFIIEVQSDRRGWNIYTSLPSNNITATLADALTRLSRPPAGLPK